MKSLAPLHVFGWPSHLGGADTKLAHLLLLLHRDYDITVVPNTREQLAQQEWRAWLHQLGVRAALLEDLPRKLSGWGLALCNAAFWTDGIALEARQRGLKIAWSSEMMWHHAGERGAAQWGLIDKVLYVSEVQRAALEAGYSGRGAGFSPLQSKCQDGLANAHRAAREVMRTEVRAPVSGGYGNGLRWHITGNYVAPSEFAWRDRRRGRRGGEFVVGRLSRADPAKFPADFPESYQRLKLKQARYRVMAWSGQLEKIYEAPPHPALSPDGGEGARRAREGESRFNGRWDLLPANAEPAGEFLRSLDLFVYDLRGDCTEAWGRAVVEAMLTGAVPLVPGDARHHLRNLVPHGAGGFHCFTRADWREHAQRLEADGALRAKMSKAAREFAVEELCNARKHRAVWRAVFEG